MSELKELLETVNEKSKIDKRNGTDLVLYMLLGYVVELEQDVIDLKLIVKSIEETANDN